jgi:hypothetical protein
VPLTRVYTNKPLAVLLTYEQFLAMQEKTLKSEGE